MKKKDIVTIDGKKYIYRTGLYNTAHECCEKCALNDICIYGAKIPFGICHLDDSTGNFQPYTEEPEPVNGRQIDERIYNELRRLGILDTSVRAYNRGASDYARHVVQPWTIWLEYNLNPWDADIVKRVLRNKKGESRRLDYEKIIHICEERIRQIDNEEGQEV